MFTPSPIDKATAANTEKQINEAVTDTPWAAEPSGDGFFRVVNGRSVILAQKCVKEEADLFAAVPKLLKACKNAEGYFCAMQERSPEEEELCQTLTDAIKQIEGR